MRIGLDYRFLGFGSLVTNRGMGRYTQQQLRSVLAVDDQNEDQNEYVLFCRSGFDPNLLLPEIRNDRRVKISLLPGLESSDHDAPNAPQRRWKLEAELQDLVASEKLDLFHATTPFLLWDLVPQRIAACPCVATHYDLIPLAFPDQYFPSEAYASLRRVYSDAMAFVSRAQRLAAISEFVKREAQLYLGVPESRIDVAYPCADSAFRESSASAAEAAISGLRERLGLHGEFVLSISHFHFSKNLDGLLRAFAAIRQCAPFRDLALVIVCQLEPHEEVLVRGVADRCGARENVVLTGLISDEELVGLFNRCRAAIHVSRYEGFGLPALEAMRCGAPLVASSTASLPEIVGSAALLADPERPDTIALALGRVLASEGLRAELREKGLERSRFFDGHRLGEQTLGCYERCAEEASSRPRRPLVSVWSPVPPQQSGVADYTFELIEWLERHVDVEVVVDDGVEPKFERPLRSIVSTAGNRGPRLAPPDRVVFQFGGSHFHLYQHEHLEVSPDLLVLHDLTWGRVRWYTARGEFAALEAEIEETEGSDAAREFRGLATTRPLPSGEAFEDFFLGCFMLRSAVQASRRQVLHFLGGDEALRARYPGAEPRYLAMGVADPLAAIPFGERRLKQRRREGSRLEIGVFGIVDPVKRLVVLASSLLRLRQEGVDARVTVVGPFVSSGYQDVLSAELGALGVADAFRFLGRVDRSEFDRRFSDVDVVVNLRWPFRSQMSATLVRAVAAGKPVIVTDVPAWRMFPEEFCRYVAPGEREVEELSNALRELANGRGRLEERGAAARRFYREHATLEVMGRAYLELLELPAVATEAVLRAEPLGASGVVQVEHQQSIEVGWALERLVPDPVERAERLRLAGGLGGTLAESAVSLALLRRFGLLGDGRRIVLLGEPGRLGEVLEELCDEVQCSSGECGVPGSPVPEDGSGATPVAADPPWATRFAPGRADAALVTRDGAAGSLDELSAVAREALRLIRPDGVVIVAFSHRLAGPESTDGAPWNGTLSEPDVLRWLVEETGGEPVEPFVSRLSAGTQSAPRDLRMERSSRLDRPLEVVRGCVLCTGYLTLRRPAHWVFHEPPAHRSKVWRQEWLKRSYSVWSASDDGAHASRPAQPSTVAEPLPERLALDHSDLQVFLKRWNEVRARSGLEPTTSEQRRSIVGFLQRTAQRIRDLGIAWDRLRDLLYALVDRHLVLVRQQELLSQEQARLAERVTALAERAPTSTANPSPAEPPPRRAQTPAGTDRGPVRVEAAPLPSLSEMRSLLREVTEIAPALVDSRSVEVSFGGVRAEALLEVAMRHFGERLASGGPEGYRAPNDLWLHVDLHGDWPLPALLANAHPRLAAVGSFVLVTRAPGSPPAIEGLVRRSVVRSQAVPGARIVWWRREDGSSHVA